jgi:hypothetical protein
MLQLCRPRPLLLLLLPLLLCQLLPDNLLAACDITPACSSRRHPSHTRSAAGTSSP